MSDTIHQIRVKIFEELSHTDLETAMNAWLDQRLVDLGSEDRTTPGVYENITYQVNLNKQNDFIYNSFIEYRL